MVAPGVVRMVGFSYGVTVARRHCQEDALPDGLQSRAQAPDETRDPGSTPNSWSACVDAARQLFAPSTIQRTVTDGGGTKILVVVKMPMSGP